MHRRSPLAETQNQSAARAFSRQSCCSFLWRRGKAVFFFSFFFLSLPLLLSCYCFSFVFPLRSPLTFMQVAKLVLSDSSVYLPAWQRLDFPLSLLVVDRTANSWKSLTKRPLFFLPSSLLHRYTGWRVFGSCLSLQPQLSVFFPTGRFHHHTSTTIDLDCGHAQQLERSVSE